MKKETYENKLFEMLGIKQKAEELGHVSESKKKTTPSSSNYRGITEDEIRSFRAAQGLVYFLQAPELFSAKVCPHCGEAFLVSRQFVAFCSYTCIRKDLEAKGFEWRKGEDIEAIVRDSYDGQEPLWITPNMVKRLQAVLASPQESLLAQTPTLPQDEPSSLTSSETNESSVVLTTT